MYTSDKRVSAFTDCLRREFTILSKWFYNNFMVPNPEKCSFMLLGVDNSLQANLVCGDEILQNKKQERMLGVTLENELNFATHSLNITENTNEKFNGLTRVQKYGTADQKNIFSSFIESQFTYCPLIWMFCTKCSLRKISNIHG